MDGGDLLVVVAAIAAGSLVKSVSGMGLPVVAVPLISLVVPLELAVVCTVLPGLALNFAVAAQEREHRHQTRDLGVLTVTGVLGGAAGAFLLVRLPEEPVLATLAVLVLAYIALALGRPEVHLDHATASRWAPAVGLAAGVMQGATGISGPVTGTWIHAYRLPRDAHVFAVSLLFGVAGLGQVGPLLAEGAFDGRWVAAVVGIPVAFLVLPFGRRLRARLSGEGFDRAVLAALGLAAVTLLGRLAL